MDGDKYNAQNKYMTIKRASKKSAVLATISTEEAEQMNVSLSASSTSNLQEESIKVEAVYKQSVEIACKEPDEVVYKQPEETTASEIEITRESLSKLKVETVIADVDKPGHVNNLTAEQTKQLYILWDHLLDVVDDKTGIQKSEDLAHQTSNSSSKLSQAASSHHASAEKKGFSLWPFRSGKKLTSSVSLLMDSKEADSSPSMSLQAQEGDHHHTLPRAYSSPILNAVSDPDLLSNKTSVTSLLSTYSQSDSSSTSSGMVASSSTTKRLVTYSEELWRGFLVGHTDSDATLLRFLRARKWNMTAATAMLTATADWRAKSGIFNLVRAGEQGLNRKLLESGKTFFHGVDKDGHLIM